MDFKNSAFMYILGIAVGAFVIAQSVYFLVKAIRRSRELGITGTVIRRTITSSAVFAVLPSVSILLGLITLSSTLGLPLPWIRLSVLGAVTYELPAATVALNAIGESISMPVSNPAAFNTVAWVMTLGCITPLIIIPLFLKKILGGVHKLRKRDTHWGDLFLTALFLGMISAFLGMVFSDIREGLKGWIPIFVLLFSAFIMGICGILVKKCNMKWLENYALPVSMLSAMVFAAVITPVIGG